MRVYGRFAVSDSERVLQKDLKFIEKFIPDMCGIGPFIPQRGPPFPDIPAGSGELTVFLLSVIRLIKPDILLPADEPPFGTIMENGREQGYWQEPMLSCRICLHCPNGKSILCTITENLFR